MPIDCSLEDGGIYQVSVYGRWNGVADVVNSYQVQLVDHGPLTLDQVRSGLKEWANNLYDLVKLVCNAVQVWEGFHASHLNGNCATGNTPFTVPIEGALTGEPYASGVAALMSFPTGVKRVTMRKYFGGLDEGLFNASGVIGATGVGLLEDIADYLMDPQPGGFGTWQYGYFSPKTETWEVPNGYLVSNIPAYQRRRRPGSGS